MHHRNASSARQRNREELHQAPCHASICSDCNLYKYTGGCPPLLFINAKQNDQRMCWLRWQHLVEVVKTDG